MNRYRVKHEEVSPLKKHESRLQELRHERKTEWHRLEDLKRTLQVRLSAQSGVSGEIRAA